jgi:hypothetical protein
MQISVRLSDGKPVRCQREWNLRFTAISVFIQGGSS